MIHEIEEVQEARRRAKHPPARRCQVCCPMLKWELTNDARVYSLSHGAPKGRGHRFILPGIETRKPLDGHLQGRFHLDHVAGATRSVQVISVIVVSPSWDPGRRKPSTCESRGIRNSSRHRRLLRESIVSFRQHENGVWGIENQPIKTKEYLSNTACSLLISYVADL